MAITFKTITQLVADVKARLIPLLPANTDYTDGTPLMNIIQSLMQEADIQYWQLQQVYNSGHIDDAATADIDKLVALLGIIRQAAIQATGTVTFSKSTNALVNYFIPNGTLVQTLPNNTGQIMQFQTTADATLLSGTTSITVPVKAVVAGVLGNVPAFSIIVMNTPPVGIETVTNSSPMSGGLEIESDPALIQRTKHILDTTGLGTVDALNFKILEVSGVKEVAIQDMNRGIGTVDILVLTDTVPMTGSKRAEISSVITSTKAAGIDFLLSEPTVDTIAITTVLTMIPPATAASAITDVTNALNNYMNALKINDDVILNQLRKVILNSNPNILDVNISIPATNITVTSTHIARPGVITVS